MKFSKSNKLLVNKENKYFKLYQLLYAHNQKYRKKQINDKNNLNRNSNFFFEKRNSYKNSSNKPITIEHYINEDISFTNNSKFTKLNSKIKDDIDFGVYYNGEFTKSRSNDNNKYYDLDNILNEKKNKSRNNNFSTKKSKNQSYCLRNHPFYKKIINDSYRGKNNVSHSSLNNDINKVILYYKNSSNSFSEKDNYKKIRKKNTINLYLVPKRIIQKLKFEKYYFSQKNKNNDNKKGKINNSLKKSNISNKISFNSKGNEKNNNNKYFKNRKRFNDMDQINRFRQIKKDLSEERIKINNMMSEFFKNPLYNKFNHKDTILEIIKQKNHLNRPRSAFS